MNTIIENIENYNELNYLEFRDNLYNIFIFHLDLNECIWEIIKYYIDTKKLNEDKIIKIVNYVYKFLNLQ